MAQGATIFKTQIQLADAVDNRYEDIDLVVAQHPSETEVRLLARIISYSLCHTEGLQMGKGLCQADQPEMWVEDLSGVLHHWIEVGQPSNERLSKALRQAPKVTVYSYQTRGEQWLAKLDVPDALRHKLTIYQLDGEQMLEAQRLVKRQMALSLSRFDDNLYLADNSDSVEIGLKIIE